MENFKLPAKADYMVHWVLEKKGTFGAKNFFWRSLDILQRVL